MLKFINFTSKKHIYKLSFFFIIIFFLTNCIGHYYDAEKYYGNYSIVKAKDKYLRFLKNLENKTLNKLRISNDERKQEFTSYVRLAEIYSNDKEYEVALKFLKLAKELKKEEENFFLEYYIDKINLLCKKNKNMVTSNEK